MKGIVQQVRTFFGIFECYNFEQMQRRIGDAYAYLMIGQEEFPVDVDESLEFLERMKRDFAAIEGDGTDMGLVYRGEQIDMERLVDWMDADSLRDYDIGLKQLTADMRSVLTVDVLEMYKEAALFLDTLSAVVDAVR